MRGSVVVADMNRMRNGRDAAYIAAKVATQVSRCPKLVLRRLMGAQGARATERHGDPSEGTTGRGGGGKPGKVKKA